MRRRLVKSYIVNFFIFLLTSCTAAQREAIPTLPPSDTPFPATATFSFTPEPTTAPIIEILAPIASIRSCPSIICSVVGIVNQDEQLLVIAHNDNLEDPWYMIDHKGELGWIKALGNIDNPNDQWEHVSVGEYVIPTPTSTHAPTQTPIIHDANFVHPVDPKIVPLYNAYDLNPASGEVNTQNPDYPARSNFFCDGALFYPGTPDNHFGWDYGTGNCSKHLVGTEVYGMSVGFDGVVTDVVFANPGFDLIRVDYGLIKCTDGQVRRIIIQFGHASPVINIGDKVNHEIQIAELEQISVEVEILVEDALGQFVDPRLLGLQLP